MMASKYSVHLPDYVSVEYDSDHHKILGKSVNYMTPEGRPM